jgi:protein-glutamine gamma-glutamyltransferase
MYYTGAGQWMEEDPIQFDAGDPNLRRYVGNDPTDATDPSGLKITIDGKAITALARDNVKEAVKKKFAILIPDGNKIIDEIAETMQQASYTFDYKTAEAFAVDIVGRLNVIKAARTFQDAKVGFNRTTTLARIPGGAAYWKDLPQGLELKEGASAAAAFRAFVKKRGPDDPAPSLDCACGAYVVFYLGLLNTLEGLVTGGRGTQLFDELASKDRAGKKQQVRLLGGEGTNPRGWNPTTEPNDKLFIPGDAVYFENPDNSGAPWLGENTIYLGNKLFFAHGIGVKSKEAIIMELNMHKNPAVAKPKAAYVSEKRVSPMFGVLLR